METRKLYYTDCHLRQFTAHVTDCARSDGGYLVELDQTAFYPEGGGQACDLGTLGDARVLDVRESAGRILHLCDRPLTAGQPVAGEIDYTRRFDLMQQHTGEHIVSGVIHARWGYHNTGFHIGGELVTIDFDGPIPPEALPEIEAAANRAVWENLPVRCWYPEPQVLPTVAYRTKRALPWPVRVVEVPGVDSCACCGVHVANTGEVGLVKLFSCVKFHQGVRIEMACGGRALAYLNAAFEQNRQVSQAFSAKLLETGDAARRMNERLANAEFRAAGLQRQVFDGIARQYRDAGDVLLIREDLEPGAVRELADRIAQLCGGTAAVFSGSDRQFSVCLVCKSGDVKALGAAMNRCLNGRGGGKPGYFQGSVNATREQIRAFWECRA